MAGPGAFLHKNGVRFRVWAPDHHRLEVMVNDKTIGLQRGQSGYFEGFVAGLKAGTLYKFRVDGEGPFPDPCSRFQPQGPHGPSMVVDSGAFKWTDGNWRGLRMHGQIFYELHIGAFTKAGTFSAARKELRELARLGITCIEIMPVAEFPGRWNWGYDGVALFAPSHVYGKPDDFKAFVNEAHARGIGVILDVVYNHLGPDGNYLGVYTKDLFSKRRTHWGRAINFDGHNAFGVRNFFIQNAQYWVGEFHLDGLRLDATQNIYDLSRRPILGEISSAARRAAQGREIIIIAENETQNAAQGFAVPQKGGFGFDAMWNDDFHHAVRVALTGFHEGYYSDFRGHPQELVQTNTHGYLRGTAVGGVPASAFVSFMENHDQVGHQVPARRFSQWVPQEKLKALTTFFLLSPQTPLLFMGQEFGARQKFPFFADHNKDLARLVWKGRKRFLAQFPTYATKRMQSRIPDPSRKATFLSAKLDFSERRRHDEYYRFHKKLIVLRKADPVINKQDRFNLDGVVLGEKSLALRYYDSRRGDRLLLVHWGGPINLTSHPYPLLAPPRGKKWRCIFSSNGRLMRSYARLSKPVALFFKTTA